MLTIFVFYYILFNKGSIFWRTGYLKYLQQQNGYSFK